MESDGFHYTKDQWGEIAKHVEAAGGEKARERLEAKRGYLEKSIVIWKQRLDKTENEASAKDLQAKTLARRYQQIAAASAKLKEALHGLNLTRIMGSDLVWRRVGDTPDKLANFRLTLDHVHRVAAQRMKPPRKTKDKARNEFLKRLALFWWEEWDLDLPWMPGKSSMTAFIVAACSGVYAIPGKNAQTTVSNAVRSRLSNDERWAARITIGGVKILTAKQKISPR